MDFVNALLALDYDSLESIATARQGARDFRLINAADQKGRKILHDRGDKEWGRLVNDARNAVGRAIRRAGGMDLVDFQLVVASVEAAAVGILAADALSSLEYALLVTPVAHKAIPELLPGPGLVSLAHVEVDGLFVAAG